MAKFNSAEAAVGEIFLFAAQTTGCRHPFSQRGTQCSWDIVEQLGDVLVKTFAGSSPPCALITPIRDHKYYSQTKTPLLSDAAKAAALHIAY